MAGKNLDDLDDMLDDLADNMMDDFVEAKKATPAKPAAVAKPAGKAAPVVAASRPMMRAPAAGGRGQGMDLNAMLQQMGPMMSSLMGRGGRGPAGRHPGQARQAYNWKNALQFVPDAERLEWEEVIMRDSAIQMSQEYRKPKLRSRAYKAKAKATEGTTKKAAVQKSSQQRISFKFATMLETAIERAEVKCIKAGSFPKNADTLQKEIEANNLSFIYERELKGQLKRRIAYEDPKDVEKFPQAYKLLTSN